MKNPERVAELLAELRELTETDFERHRIDVLDRDLTTPPIVEIIDDTHQRFDGVVYRKDSCGHYENDLRIHRAVWSYYHGKIPDDYQIHHIDKNKTNNAIENLQCLTRLEHRKAHSKKGTRVATPKKKIFTCDHCGKQYEASDQGKNRYCSEKCKRRHVYQENIRPFICQHCGKTFSANRHNKPKFCSIRCAQAHRYLGHRFTRKCLVCGKTFETTSGADAHCCSNHCAAVLREREKANRRTELPS